MTYINNQIIETFLSTEDKTNIINKIINEFNSKNCLICHNNIKIPVYLNEKIFCKDCGDIKLSIVCLECSRIYLQLNKPIQKRTSVKHLICSKLIDTKYLNAKISYYIDYNLITLLDTYSKKELKCSCNTIFTSHKQLHEHKKDGSCKNSYFKCSFCGYYGISKDYIQHMSKMSCNIMKIAYMSINKKN